MKYFLISFTFLFYSLIGLVMKNASNNSFMSMEFILKYIFILLLLVIYSILWQKVLNYFPLSIAYSYKGTTVLWTLLWSTIFLNEKVTLFNILGSLIILIGITQIKEKE